MLKLENVSYKWLTITWYYKITSISACESWLTNELGKIYNLSISFEWYTDINKEFEFERDSLNFQTDLLWLTLENAYRLLKENNRFISSSDI
jgi:hypothetical protein